MHSRKRLNYYLLKVSVTFLIVIILQRFSSFTSALTDPLFANLPCTQNEWENIHVGNFMRRCVHILFFAKNEIALYLQD